MLTTLIQSARPPFLLLPLCCVFVSVMALHYLGVSYETVDVILVTLGAVLANVSVNALNEYQDFSSGLDFVTERTPFSGGSGALVSKPEHAKGVLMLGCASLLIVGVIGLYFVQKQGWEILPLGVLGALTILLYTDTLNRHPFLCLIAPGLGFGTLMVLGTGFALSGEYLAPLLMLSFLPFFQINNLLLLNQFPDARADETVGRRHFIIAYGVTDAVQGYAIFAVAAYGVIGLGVITGTFPVSCLLGFLTLPLAGLAWFKARQLGMGIGNFPPAMAANVMCSLLTPVLVGIGFWVG